METGAIGARIRRLMAIKAQLKWDDSVGGVFDEWFAKLNYGSESLERYAEELKNKVDEITRRASLEDLENMYASLVKLYSEAEG